MKWILILQGKLEKKLKNWSRLSLCKFSLSCRVSCFCVVESPQWGFGYVDLLITGLHALSMFCRVYGLGGRWKKR